MALTKASFQKGENLLFESATDQNAVHYPLWIVPTLFCTMRYINDARFLIAYEDVETELVQDARKNSMDFYQTEIWGTLLH